MQVVLQKWETDIVCLFCKYIYIMDGFYLRRIWEKATQSCYQEYFY